MKMVAIFLSRITVNLFTPFLCLVGVMATARAIEVAQLATYTSKGIRHIEKRGNAGIIIANQNVPEALEAVQIALNTRNKRNIVCAIESLRAWLESPEGLAYRQGSHRLYETYVSLVRYLGLAAVKAINEVLDDINEQLLYWQLQALHQWDYFFKKSPHKWFVGDVQKDEIARNIKTLMAVRAKQEAALGALVRALQNCPTTLDEHGCWRWCNRLMCIFHDFYLDPDKRQCKRGPCEDDRALLCAIDQHLTCIGEHKNDYCTIMYVVSKPSHLVRHWMTYFFVGIAACYCCQDPHGFIDIAVQRVSQLAKRMPTLWQNYVTMPLQNLMHKIFYGDVLHKKVAPQKSAKLDAFVAKIDSETDALVSKVLNEMVNVNNVPAHVYDQIREGLETNNAEVFYEKYVEPMRLFWLTSRLTFETKQKLWGDYCRLKVNFILLDGLRSIQEMAHNVNKTITDLEMTVYQKLTQLDSDIGLTLKLTSLFPAGLLLMAGFTGIHSFYVWLRRSDYAALNAVLCDIHDQLILAGDTITDQMFGRIIHLTHILHCKAEKILGKNHKDYQQFITYGKQLIDSTLSTQQKKELIAAMRTRYSFLRER
jgi:hypothetical protein